MTALLTLSAAWGWNTLGIIYCSFRSSSEMTEAIAYAAASFIDSVIREALQSSTPRNMPGKHNTLLI